jgi:hypothetical protein
VIADDADWFYICRTDNLLADRLSLEDVSSCSLLGDEALSLNFVFRRSDESLRLIIRCAPDDTDSVGDTVSRLALVAERRYAATLTDLGLQPPGERGK